MYFDLTFEGTHFTPALQQKFFQLMKEQPLQRYKNFLGYLLGQFLIFSEYYTDYTTVPLTFRVLNLTYTSDLMDKNSARYRQHARLFCEDVSTWDKQCPNLSFIGEFLFFLYSYSYLHEIYNNICKLLSP